MVTLNYKINRYVAIFIKKAFGFLLLFYTIHRQHGRADVTTDIMPALNPLIDVLVSEVNKLIKSRLKLARAQSKEK